MSSIFFRIYGGLLFTLVLVSLLAGLSIATIHNMQQASHRENMVSGLFQLIAQTLNELTPEQQPEWLNAWGRQLTIPFTVVSREGSTLTGKALKKLRRGGINVTMLDQNRALVSVALGDGQILQGTVESISEQTISGVLRLLREHIAQWPKDAREEQLAQRVHRAFDYPVRLIPADSAALNRVQQEQLRMGSVLLTLDTDARSVSLYASTPEDSRLLKAGPIALLNPYPLKLVLTLALFFLSSISCAIYVLVRGMEKRLRKLERAATQFSQGDFGVRVSLGGADSIGSLAQAFNAMASHIQRLLGLQKEMIRGVSHELRTPVARLRFGLDLVADARTQEEREQQLEGMDKDIQELDDLVDEILTFANLEQGAPEIRYKRHNVDKVIIQVIEEYKRLQDKIVIRHIPCTLLNRLLYADIDFRYIHRAVQNLVGNACRYADSTVEVHFSATQDNCRIDVDDDGPGILEDKWDRVFSAFSRLDDSRTRKSGGYGLGLSIVRRIMYWHNGRAMVSHSPLGGARLSLVWPRKQRR